MSSPGTLRFAEVNLKPSAPPSGYNLLYIKVDGVLYLQDSSGTETALGSASAITALTGEATAVGPGSAVITLSNSAVIGKVLTGFVSGPNSVVLATDTILEAIEKLQAQVSASVGSAITSLTGDVSATGPGAASATVNSVGGASASDIAISVSDTQSATSTNTPSTIVKRDGSGNFAAGIITANLTGNVTGNVSGSSATFTGNLLGDVTGTQSATVVSTVGGKTAAQVATSVNDTLAATSTNTASTIVKRDASGNFAAGTITASLSGNATTATTSTNFSGSLLGDVTGTQSATVVSTVGGKSAASIAQSVTDTQAATSSNTASTIVKRDASGNFSANSITANLVGNVTGNVTGTAGNVTGIVAIANGGTNSSVPLNNNRVIKSSGGAIIEAAAITANRALISDVNGIPTHSVTTDTELSYVSGVTSSIQTQINSITGSSITALTGDVSATGPGSVPATVNSVGGSSAANINSAEIAANAATSANTPNTIVKRDGSGNFNAGTITANLTGLVNGVDPASHEARHLPTGADALTTAAPLANLSATTTNAVGTANSLARSDHSHAISTGTPSTQTPDQSNSAGSSANLARADHIHNIPSGAPVQIGTSNVQGSAGTFSLSDHIHSHGNQTVGTLHAAATISVNGFMSSTDKTKLDAITGTNTGDVTLAAVGSSPNANAASLSGQILNLQPADATNPGVVNNTTQTLSGNKTLSGQTSISNTSTTALTINSTSFVFDATNNAQGIGITPATNTFIDAVNSTGATKRLVFTGYGVGSTVGFRNRFARGTSGTPSAVQTGDTLGFISGQGYGTSQFPATSTGAANFVAGENFTNTSNLTYFAVQTTPTGSVTATENFRVASTGLTLGPQSSSTAIHQVNGGVYKTTRTITANLTIDTTTTDYYILCNHSGAINITLPVPVNGREFVIKDISGAANTNNITLVRNGSEKIEGLAASRLLQTNFGFWRIVSDGTNWHICG